MQQFVSIGMAARMLGVCINTLRLWHKSGFLVPSFSTQGGHRRYRTDEILEKSRQRSSDEAQPRLTIAYARVSTHDQKADLEVQQQRLRMECEGRGWTDVEYIKDLGSGMNYAKKGLRRLIGLICAGHSQRLVLLREDRLLRFGAALVFELCRLRGCEVVLIEPRETDPRKTLAEDVLAIMTVFSARCSGLKSHSNKKALARA